MLAGEGQVQPSMPGFTVERGTKGWSGPQALAILHSRLRHRPFQKSSGHFSERGPQGTKPWIQECLTRLVQKAENQCSGMYWCCRVTVQAGDTCRLDTDGAFGYAKLYCAGSDTSWGLGRVRGSLAGPSRPALVPSCGSAYLSDEPLPGRG